MTKIFDIRPVLDDVRAALDQNDLDGATSLIAAIHPADAAAILDELEFQELQDIFARLAPEQGADVLIELDSDSQLELTQSLTQTQFSDLIAQMEPDDAADVLFDLEPAQIEATLAALDPEESDDVRQLLSHAEESAGGLMNSHVVTLRDRLTAQQAIDLLRQLRPEEENVYYLFVVDAAERLVGVISLRSLVMAPANAPLASIMDTNVLTATVETDQEECARLLSRYDLLVLPIVDDERRIVGVINADDIIDVIEEEATEDMYRLANLSEDEDVEDTLFRSSRRRLFWLFVNLPTAILAAWVVSRFDGTVSRVTALVSFMPIIAGMGGNAGIQTLTLIVRSMALGEVAAGQGLRALRREMAIGAINGIAFGSAIAVLGMIWKGNPMLGLVAGSAMLLNLISAAVAGTVVPLTLKFFHIDPALASGVIVTTVTDVTGYACLLGMATLLISYLV
ncbi:MAG: magnesium transporter [Herpetosiphonaceae bacterium]|nr:magnesium transporter [Herpetosiphonaceae bacterium]